MAYQDDFELWKAEIENLPPEEVRLPNVPIDEFVERTAALAVAANEDRDALAAAGMDTQVIDDLPTLGGALRYCQAEWMSIFRARQQAKADWIEQSPAAFALRDELLHHFSFAYRDDDNLSDKVLRIREGSSRTDMVQDLLEMAVLGKNNPEPLAKINFNNDLLTEAETTAHQMDQLLAAANGDEGDSNATKQLRDRAFTLLYNKDSVVREYGRYVFWKDEAKRNRYLT